MDRYLIRVEGVLSADSLRDFGDLVATPGPVQTVLQGELPDQSSLAGILDYLDQMGVEILEVLKVPSPGGDADAPSAESA